jgi:hypothetical protein
VRITSFETVEYVISTLLDGKTEPVIDEVIGQKSLA